MGKITLPEKAKLFIGIISVNEEIILTAKPLLIDLWGTIDFESPFYPFNLTEYYQEEMGPNLLKKFYSFEKLIAREDIVEIKIKTNELEEQIKINQNKDGRDINLDPGYLTLSNITLGTTKDFAHRIYLNKGIYLENTLRYSSKAKSYIESEWTFPDFRQQSYLNFFNQLRVVYKEQLKQGEDFDRKSINI